MDFAWSSLSGEPVRIVSTEDLWGKQVATVIVPSSGRVERVPADQLLPLSNRAWSPAEIAFRAATGLAWKAMEAGEPLAVARGGVDALPHQTAVLERGLAAEPVRLLLADEVGLGKTIEAGLIYSELKARGTIRRVLIVCPKGVQLQWLTEMSERFGERFVLVGAGGVPLDAGIDPWSEFDQVVCTLDAIKPVRSRAAWSPERVALHNEPRMNAILAAGWDLLIIDEAHHVSGSAEDVARHQAGLRLAASVPNVLLLSATPHSGKSEAFARLLGLLDDRFLHGQPIRRDTVAPLVVRTEKRKATDAAGRPLFRPRTTKLVTVGYGQRVAERELYEAVTSYVRHGYRRAIETHRPAVGFLVLLMQRLASSSTAAIQASLERRLAAVTEETRQLTLFPDRAGDWEELTGEEQQAVLAESHGAAWAGERAEIEMLLDLTRKATSEGLDAKARYLLDLLNQIARAEGNPAAKAVIFTEFVPTQRMLLDILAATGIEVVAVDGSMSIMERKEAQDAFRTRARVLVSTDAGGEGVNLQFAHTVINYDLPWSPTRIEQRIGRVDRIGQPSHVAAYNLVLESSIDARVLEVLEAKLAVILEELGVDKTGDVLASTDVGVDQLYTAAILNPERVEDAADALEQTVRRDIAQSEPLREAIGASPPHGRAAYGGTLRHWLEAIEEARANLESEGILVGPGLPEVFPGEPIPVVKAPAPGWWTMWEVNADGNRSVLTLFSTDSGAIRPDLAERIWTDLADEPRNDGAATLDPATYEQLRRLAADHGYRRTERKPPALTLRLAARAQA